MSRPEARSFAVEPLATSEGHSGRCQNPLLGRSLVFWSFYVPLATGLIKAFKRLLTR